VTYGIVAYRPASSDTFEWNHLCQLPRNKKTRRFYEEGEKQEEVMTKIFEKRQRSNNMP